MSFLRHLLPAWKRGIEDKRKANAAILASIDRELKDTEAETIKSKMLMSLNTAEGEWLDQYGKLFGVLRREDEEDSVYRARIIAYVLLKRGTIPAIKEAIQAFLGDYGDYIEIYEPYKNVFTLNKSKLNGPDHFLGQYYTVAVIDIRISKPFPAGIVDVINEFKPAGVTFRLTYRRNSHDVNADVVSLPLDSSEFMPSNTYLDIMTGMNDRIRGHLNLTAISREPGSGLFTLNNSKLNSLDRLAGSLSAANASYNLASFSESDLLLSDDTTITDILNQTQSASQDFYTKTGRIDGQYAAQTLDTGIDSYMYFTMDVATYLSTKYADYLREAEPSGVYTKDTYISLMDKLYIQYRLAAIAATAPEFTLQVFNVETNAWEDSYSGTATVAYKKNTVSLPSDPNYLSKEGVMFVRFKFAKVVDEGTPYEIYQAPSFTSDTYEMVISGGSFTDGEPTEAVSGNYGKSGVTYDVRFDFFEIGFVKDVAIRPVIDMFSTVITSATVITDASVVYTTYRGIESTDETYDFVVDGGTLANHTYDETVDGSYKDYTS